ncbi:L-threonine 3-dehydrogenase [Humidisolicoccus flavus]|uniref:L-threonine 3-dehydrogenase n=1 Tax=Humidisolicoccus flavus TaxID=3111414 RepID=UPI00324ECD90
MRALSKVAPRAGLELIEAPMPTIGERDVLIRVHRTGICGTDLHIESWDAWASASVEAPIIPGHEFVGEVIERGTLVNDIPIGALVSGEGHIVCGTCRNCRAGRAHMCIRTSGLGVNRNGAFAEYVALPETNVWIHHTEIDKDTAAVFDPLGNAVHTALSFPLIGEDVLITGAGPIGLMAIAVARHAGARFIVATDVSPERLMLARQMGADLALDVRSERIESAQATLGMREGFDIGLEMSGHSSALPEMIDNLTHGGRIAMLGLPAAPITIDWSKVVTHMLTIKGIYGREMFETWNAMSAMLQSSETLRTAIDAVITARYPAAQWQAGFDEARGAHGGKVVLDWTAPWSE